MQQYVTATAILQQVESTIEVDRNSLVRGLGIVLIGVDVASDLPDKGRLDPTDLLREVGEGLLIPAAGNNLG